MDAAVRSNAASLHASAMDEESKKVDADMRAQAESVKAVKEAQRKAMKEELEEDAKEKKDIMKPSAPHKMFRPSKSEPKKDVAKKAIEEDGQREGALQNKMQDMMGSMEKIRASIDH